MSTHHEKHDEQDDNQEQGAGAYSHERLVTRTFNLEENIRAKNSK
jgi:hypothetical protein